MFAATLWPLVCSFTTLVLTFVLGRRFGGDGAGLVAAAAFALLPLDVSDSTNVLPDPVLGTFAALSVWCYLRGFEELRVGRARGWLVMAGVCLWCAYSAKTVGALVAIVFALHACTGSDGLGIPARRRVLRLGWVALGALLLLVPEMAWYAARMGDPFFSLAVIGDVHEQSSGVIAANEDLGWRLWKDYPRKTLLPNEHFGFLGPFLLLAALALLPRFGRLRILYIWVLVIGAYLNFGSSNLSRFVAIPANTRYLHAILVPALLLFALATCAAWRACGRFPSWSRIARGGLLATGGLLALSLIGTSYLRSGRGFAHLTAQEGLAAARDLERDPAGVVYTDARTARVLDFAFGYQPPFEIRHFPEPLPVADASAGFRALLEPGATVLLNWREVYKAGDHRVLTKDLSLELRKVPDLPEFELEERFGRRPNGLYERVASMPCFRAGLRRDDKLEFLLFPERPRGIWRYRYTGGAHPMLSVR